MRVAKLAGASLPKNVRNLEQIKTKPFVTIVYVDPGTLYGTTETDITNFE